MNIESQQKAILPSGSYIYVPVGNLYGLVITDKDIEYTDIEISLQIFSNDSNRRENIKYELSGSDDYDWLVYRIGPVKIDNIFYGIDLPTHIYRVAVIDNGEYWDVISYPQDNYFILIIEDTAIIDIYDYDDSAILNVIHGDFPPGGVGLHT